MTLSKSSQKSTPHSTRRAKLFGLLRLVLFCFCISLIFTALSVRSVLGEMRESTARVGRGLLQMRDIIGESTTLKVNGGTLHASGHFVEQDLDAVLNRFQEHCEGLGWSVEDVLKDLPKEQQAQIPDRMRAHKVALHRDQNENEGFVVCLLAPEGKQGFKALSEGILAFMETGDLKNVGDLRYVFARRLKEARGTEAVTVWADEQFNVFEMFDPEGDVPGRDTEGVPRLKDAKRILNVESPGLQHAVRAYETHESARAAMLEYDRILPQIGWKSVNFEKMAKKPGSNMSTARAFLKGNAAVALTAVDTGEATHVYVVEMGSRGVVEMKPGQN